MTSAEGGAYIDKCAWSNFPLYRYLVESDADGYERYRTEVDTFAKREDSMAWEEFLSLTASITTGGFINYFSNPIVVTSRLGQLDGAHRLAILFASAGPRSSCVVIDGQVFIPKEPKEGRISSREVEDLEFVVRLTRVEADRLDTPPGKFFWNAVNYWAPDLLKTFTFSDEQTPGVAGD